jgi:hypothetical protein
MRMNSLTHFQWTDCVAGPEAPPRFAASPHLTAWISERILTRQVRKRLPESFDEWLASNDAIEINHVHPGEL